MRGIRKGGYAVPGLYHQHRVERPAPSMNAVLTAAQSAALDEATNEPIEVLMDRAGLGVALAAVDMGIGYGSTVVVLAGPGNNGGDGYVAARHLRNRGVAVSVHAFAEPRTIGAKWADETARAAGVPIRPWTAPVAADLIIDALFGAGFRGNLPDTIIPWAKATGRVLSVDVPSGLNATDGSAGGATFRAERTVTFHSKKVGHFIGIGPDISGVVEVVDIGLPEGPGEFLHCDRSDAPLPHRRRTSHKWSTGSVAIVGGGRGMTGAALLAAHSALGAGAGSVSIVCPSSAQAAYAGSAPGVLTHSVGIGATFSTEDALEVLDYSERFDVLVIGPGLGAGVDGFVWLLLDRWNGPVVLDADGINALPDPDLLRNRTAPTIITPHAGEFQRLTGGPTGYLEAAALARGTGAVVLLKGNPTFIAADDIWVVDTGGPELATIGTGDVLTGIAAAFVASGMSSAVAARSAAYWHGITGAALAKRENVTAPALASEVRRVIR